MGYRGRITIGPGKRSGKPCIRGLRITVSDVLDYLAGGMSEDEILADSPIPSAMTFGSCSLLPPTARAV